MCNRRLQTALELKDRQPARHRQRHKLTEVVFQDAFVEESLSNERHEIIELGAIQHDRLFQVGIEAIQDRLDRTEPKGKVRIHTCVTRVVVAGGVVHVQVMLNGVFQSRKCAIVEERRRHGHVSQRGGAELVAVRLYVG